MTVFWISAAAMTAAAMLFVLLPLLKKRAPGSLLERALSERDAANVRLYRDALAELENERDQGTLIDSQFQEAKSDLDRRLVEEAPARPADAPSALAPTPKWLAPFLGVVMPLAAVSVYLLLGNPDAMDPLVRASRGDASHDVQPEQIVAMVEKLAARMEKSPDDPQGWSMLARSYVALGNFEKAAPAYSRLVKLVPDDAGLLADYADVLAMVRGRKLAGEPHELVKRALKLDPNQFKALALAGSAEFERKNYPGAVVYWERSAAQLPADSEFRHSVLASIDEARRLGKLPAAQANTANAGPMAAAAAGKAQQDTGSGAAAPAGKALTGLVKLAPALASQVQPGDTLFIFARPAQGSRMPLAIIRETAGKLPFRFRLDDSLAMTPQARISGHELVLVGARISKSGNAMPQPGDLQGTSRPVAPGASGMEITIDEVVK